MKHWSQCTHDRGYARYTTGLLRCDQCFTIIPRGHPAYEKEEKFAALMREHNRNGKKIRENERIPEDFEI